MEILSVSGNSDVWFVLPIALLTCTLLVLGIFDGKDKGSSFQIITCLILCVLVIFGSYSLIKSQVNKKILKVIVTDMEEVDLDKYKITGNEGKVITLQEK